MTDKTELTFDEVLAKHDEMWAKIDAAKASGAKLTPDAPTKLDTTDWDAIQKEADAKYGKVELVKQEDKDEPEYPEQDAVVPLPMDISNVDLSSPVGFVGDVVDWIDGQCRYSRRRLAVAAGITAIGNIGGLSHEEDLQGTTANMMTFCVAASSTGKEAVLQAFNELHRAAGINKARQDAFKSEQEIARNLLDHQAAYYCIDEIGIFLRKVLNAQKGGASYLEGIFGQIMAIYSKADSFYGLTGDGKRELQKIYAAMLSKAQDNNDEEKIEFATRKLNVADAGLERPFLSLMGFTTPSTFDGLMTGEMATQGFVGRSIIIHEPDINPLSRKGFKKTPMPMMMAGRLGVLYGGADGHDVEYRGDRRVIKTDKDAAEALFDIDRWINAWGDRLTETNGEAAVALVRRGIELIGKVSFILAIPEGHRTIEHVRWALAYVKRELDYKVRLVFANDNAKDDPTRALRARLLNFLDKDKGVSTAVMVNKTKVDAVTVASILNGLIEEGHAVNKETGKTYRGKKVKNWYATS